MAFLLFSTFLVLFSTISSEEMSKQRPNIVFIVADDLGFNDVSFRGSDQIMTPNIDLLAYNGLILQNYYTDTQGSSSRSELFTGKYSIRLGTQGSSISACEDRGIPVSERLLPNYLRRQGYSTNLIGKWNVGKSRQHYLPTQRGFDTFYGFLDGSVDYFTYNLIENHNGTEFYGINLYEDMEPIEDQRGHITDVLTERAVQIIRYHNTSLPLYLHLAHAAPHAGGGFVSLQPPDEAIAANEHIAHSARRLYAGLVTSLDKSVGHIVAALAERDILNNTLIIFVSDNGAPTRGRSQNFGSNVPLRGIKNTPWEGAIHSNAVIWHKDIPHAILNGIFHVTDWLPTLVSAAGGNVQELIDGVNQWGSIINNESSNRIDLLLTIDDLRGWAAFREGDYKIIIGDVNREQSEFFGNELKALRRPAPFYENLLFESETARVFKETLQVSLDMGHVNKTRLSANTFLPTNMTKRGDLCFPTKAKGCLYNITNDPLELTDLWHSSIDLVSHMTLRLRSLWAEVKYRPIPKCSHAANPALHNYIWGPWLSNQDPTSDHLTKAAPFPSIFTQAEIRYMFDLNLNNYKDMMFSYIKNMSESFVKSVSNLYSF